MNMLRTTITATRRKPPSLTVDILMTLVLSSTLYIAYYLFTSPILSNVKLLGPYAYQLKVWLVIFVFYATFEAIAMPCSLAILLALTIYRILRTHTSSAVQKKTMSTLVDIVIPAVVKALAGRDK